MTTSIFENYATFQARSDKKINGVSAEFAEKHPDYIDDNKTNEGCWECVECKLCLECDKCRGCKWCKGCEGCRLCEGCEDLTDAPKIKPYFGTNSE